MAIDYTGLDTALADARSSKESDALLQELAMTTGKNLYGAWGDYQDLRTTEYLGEKFKVDSEKFDIYDRSGNWFTDMFRGHKGRLEYSDDYLEHLDAGTLPDDLDVLDLTKKGTIKGIGGPLKNFFGNLPQNKPMSTYKMGPTTPGATSPSTSGITKYVGGETVTAATEGLKGASALSKVGSALDTVGNVLGPVGSIAGLATTDVDALTGKHGDTAQAKAVSGAASSAIGTYALLSPEPISKTLAAIATIAGLGSV